MINKLLGAFWANTKRMDDKRIKTLTMPDGIFESNDHAYLPDGHVYHKLDVYYPEKFEGKLPVIIDIHGGGWMYGDKELNKPYCLELARRGNVVFNMSYRLFPEVTANQQLQDIGHALKWIAAHLEDYPCDLDSICLTGDSAGGMLSMFTAMLCESAELRDAYDVVDSGLRFDAVCLTCPMTRMDQKPPMGLYTKHVLGKGYQKEKWGAYVNVDTLLPMGKMPPTFLVSSTGDFLANKDTLYAYNAMKKAGVECELQYWNKVDGQELPHVFPVIFPNKEPSRIAIDGMLRFFKNHRK